MNSSLKRALVGSVVWCSGLMMSCCGCNKEEASSIVAQVEDSAAETAEAIQAETGEAVERTREAASEFGEKVTSYLNPLKEKFGNLESLKDKPEELKEAVTGLIASIDERAEDIELPEELGKILTAAKEKLLTLKSYLEGEVDQAKVDEQIQEIMSSIKSQFGMTSNE
ncbi:MAG: hypothetical protein AAGI63_05500 [Planctomycetota bacterium]